MPEQLVRCEGCPHFGKLVGTRGPEDSPFVIVGESPGFLEIREEIPFCGPSGKILAAALAQQPGPEPYITNAMQCFPGTAKQKDQDNVRKAAHLCQHALYERIRRHPRKVILALGAPAIWSLTNNFGLKITQCRGRLFPSDLAEYGIVASVHPSFLMHGGGSLRQFLSDIDYAISLTKDNNYRNYIIPSHVVHDTEEKVNELANEIALLPPETPIAADTETGGFSGFDHLRDHILCAGFCWDPLLVHIVPGELIPYTKRLFAADNVKFVWHNGKFDGKFFRAQEVQARIDEDTMLLSYALEENGGVHDLETIASDFLGAPDWKFMIKPYVDEWKKNNKKQQQPGYSMVPREVLYDYMSRDISSTLQVFPILRRQVSIDPKLELLYTRTLMPASGYFMQLEEKGLELDPIRVQENEKRLIEQCERFAAEINVYAEPFGLAPLNPRSPQQLAVLLFDALKLPSKVRGTDIKVLEKLDHPVVTSLKKYRKVEKARSTYTTPAHEWPSSDGRVHTSILIHGTATGRPASRDPNILNIPRDPLLRGMFKARKGYVYVEVDANQAELRVLAELSKDEDLTRIYTTKGMSVHDEACVAIFGKHSEYTPQIRQMWLEKFNCVHIPGELYNEQKMRAKNVNFGIPYGITEFGLSEQIDCTPGEARIYIAKWRERFKGADNFLRRCREAPVKNQTLVTPFGRKKRFGVVSREQLMFLQNEASNFPEQSITSDVVLHTGMKMVEFCNTHHIDIVNTVYDSILYEVPFNLELIKELSARTITVLAETAKEWGIVRIPFVGEAKVGFRWGSLIDIKKFLPIISKCPPYEIWKIVNDNESTAAYEDVLGGTTSPEWIPTPLDYRGGDQLMYTELATTPV